MTSGRKTEIAIAMFALYFQSGSMTTPLTSPGSDSAPGVQIIGAALGLGGFVYLLMQRGALSRSVARCWPALLPVIFATVTVVWSVDPSLSQRRAGALILTTVFAFWLVERFDWRSLFDLLLWSSLLVVVTNAVFIMLVPDLGIHQSNDLEGSNQAGAWRGLFFHKNDFGRAMALSASILFIAMVARPHMRWFAIPAFALCGYLIYFSFSAQSLLLYVVVPLFILVFYAMMKVSPVGRGMFAVLALPIFVAVALSYTTLFESILGLLAKDITLTGRTWIWNAVYLAMEPVLWLGGGFGAGWEYVGQRVYALTGIDVGHAHNGYLDLGVDLGIIGLTLVIGFLCALFWLSFLRLMRGQCSELALVGLAVVVFSVIGNWVGSFLLKYNSLYWVLSVACFYVLWYAPCRAATPSAERDGFANGTDPTPRLLSRRNGIMASDWAGSR